MKNLQTKRLKQLLLIIGPSTITIATIATLVAFSLDEVVSRTLEQKDPSKAIDNTWIAWIRNYSYAILFTAGANTVIIATFAKRKEHNSIKNWAKLWTIIIPAMALMEVAVTNASTAQKAWIATMIIATAITLFTIFCDEHKENESKK